MKEIDPVGGGTHHGAPPGSANDNNNDGEFKEEFTHAYHFKRLFERTLNIPTSSETISYDHSILEM